MSRPDLQPHRWPIRVYYEDTDFSGVVYHANYLRFLERGRTEFLRALGIEQAALHDGQDPTSRWAFAVRHMDVGFLAPARMDDVLQVETRVQAVGGASVLMTQAVLRGETRLVEAVVKVALVEGRRARRLPAELAGRLRSVSVESRGPVP